MRYSLAILVLLTTSCFGQGGNTITITASGAPTGSCSYIFQYIDSATGNQYNCKAAAWNLIGGASAPGTVTSFSAGTLSPLFTTSVATATTTPALSFSLSTAAANTIFGNATGSTAAPTFTAAPSITSLTASSSVSAATHLTATNCSSSASPAVCSSAAAGSVAVPTGTNPTLVVNTTAVTANSQIFVQSDDTLGTKLSVTCNSTLTSLAVEPVVTARTAATSFTISINGVISTNPVCLSYFILN